RRGSGLRTRGYAWPTCVAARADRRAAAPQGRVEWGSRRGAERLNRRNPVRRLPGHDLRVARWRRIALWAGASVVTLALVALVGAVWTVRSAVPAYDGQLRLAGLPEPV